MSVAMPFWGAKEHEGDLSSDQRALNQQGDHSSAGMGTVERVLRGCGVSPSSERSIEGTMGRHHDSDDDKGGDRSPDRSKKSKSKSKKKSKDKSDHRRSRSRSQSRSRSRDRQERRHRSESRDRRTSKKR